MLYKIGSCPIGAASIFSAGVDAAGKFCFAHTTVFNYLRDPLSEVVFFSGHGLRFGRWKKVKSWR